MRINSFLASTIILIFIFLTACHNNITYYSMPKLNNQSISYHPPQAETWKLSNGLQVLFIHDPELPLFSGTLYTRQGALSLPSEQQTIATALGSLMRSGGAGNLSAQALDEELKSLSASISSSVSGEFSSFGFSGLISDRRRIFELLADVVLRPRFQKERLEIWRSQAKEDIARRIESPSTIASITFNQLLYPDSIFGQVAVSEDLAKVSIDRLKSLHSQLIKPDQAILAVTGAIAAEDLKALVNQHFANWQSRGHKLSAPPEVSRQPASGIYLIERPLEQSTILMGQLGIKRLSPEHTSAIVFNQILSSGMSGRLMNRLRVELGLVYSAYGSITPGVVKGSNTIGIQTKTDSTLTSIEESLKIIRQLQTELVTPQELNETYQYLSNSFIFRFAEPDALVSRYAMLNLLNYPKDYDLKYLDSIAAIRAEDVRSVAAQQWEPSSFVIVVVGSADASRLIETAAKVGSGSALAGMPVRRVNFSEKAEL